MCKESKIYSLLKYKKTIAVSSAVKPKNKTKYNLTHQAEYHREFTQMKEAVHITVVQITQGTNNSVQITHRYK